MQDTTDEKKIRTIYDLPITACGRDERHDDLQTGPGSPTFNCHLEQYERLFVIKYVRTDHIAKSSRQPGAVGYEPKIQLLDKCRPLRLGLGQFLRCLFRGTTARTRGDDATEHRYDRG